MSPFLEFRFKVVQTEINRTYRVSPYITVAEFIEKIKREAADDDLRIANFDLVPLCNNILHAEDGPALQPTQDLITTIYNTNPTFLYIRPVESISTERSSCVVCMSSERRIAFVSCGHLCICRDCSNNASITVCPICRNPDSMRVEIFDP